MSIENNAAHDAPKPWTAPTNATSPSNPNSTSTPGQTQLAHAATPLQSEHLDVYEAAQEYWRHGFSVIPIGKDKAPLLDRWTEYMQRRATEAELKQWQSRFSGHGVGIACGVASGGFEVTELEGRAATEENMNHIETEMKEVGIAHLWQRMNTWVDESPSGGLHYCYRISDQDVPGNRKIAKDGSLTLCETRGQGGQMVMAPSTGYCHSSGKPWKRLRGEPGQCPSFTMSERDQVHAVLKLVLHVEPPKPETPPRQAQPATFANDRLTPGNDYEQRTDWRDILEPYGWKLHHTSGRVRYWTRPGKEQGVSATTGHDPERDRLWVFSTSTVFNAEESHTKFGAYAVLNHGGDMHAAAKELAQQGYGEPSPEFDVTPKSNVIPLPSRERTGDQTGIPAQTGNLAVFPAPERNTVKAHQLTEEWNAQQLIRFYGDKIRYVADSGRWFAWNGHQWEKCPRNGGIVRQLAKRTLMQDVNLDDNGGSLSKWLKQSLKAAGITNMLKQAETDERVSIDPVDLDANPHVLNTPAGVVDLRTGKLEAPDPSLLCTKSTSVAPDFDMPTPKWDAFLADTFAGHPGLIDYIQTLAGYSATGTTGHHVLPFLYGSGANGKSLFLGVLQTLLGDYATSKPANFLMKGKDEHLTEIADLQGVRLAVGTEVNESAKFDEAKVKLLTGGDQLSARFMRGDYFDFRPTHHLWIAGNNLPEVETGGYSFWRRVRTIPFTNQVPEHKRVENLQEQLTEEEGAGILAWIIQGAVRYLNSGIGTEPSEVLKATRDYKAREDHFGRFIDERVKVGGGDMVRVTKAEMKTAYVAWCEQEDVKRLPQQKFNERARAHGIGESRSNNVRYFTNCMLLDISGDSEKWDDLGGLKP